MSVTTLPTITVNYDSDWTDDFVYENQPSHTYKLHPPIERVRGITDELDACKQSVYKILNTERYEYVIYSWNYGIELNDLFGKHIAYVVPELERRITEAIMQDDRMESVTNFEFDTSRRGVVSVTFTVKCVFGEFQMEKIVEFEG